MKIAALIIGIDGWEQYTKPLMDSLFEHEPDALQVVIDNASCEPYPELPETWRTDRMCYSAAINRARLIAGPADWYIVLSNDVLCRGPFADTLAAYGDGDLVGPRLMRVSGFDYLEGWCVAIPARAWQAVGGWDERFLGSDWEDVAFSTAARQKGFGLVEDLPFVHLDQKQRFQIIENFWEKDAHNRELFMREYARAVAL